MASMATGTKKRISIKFKSPNPLFEEWLTKWREEAIAKDSKLKYPLKLALQSLKRYPIPLETGQQCKILKGFGEKLCKMLDDKLKEHKSILNKKATEADIAGTILHPVQINNSHSNAFEQCSNDAKPKKPRTKKPKATKKTLDSQLDKYENLLEKDSPPANHINMLSPVQIDSSINNRLENDQFLYNGRPSLYGTNSSQKPATITNINNSSETVCTNDIEYSATIIEKELQNLPSRSTSSLFSTSNSNLLSTDLLNPSESSAEQYIINSNTFDIILYVDKCETFSNKDKNEIITNLSKRIIKYEVKDLKVGDFTWVCRERFGDVELVLPYIIERKRMDDLAHSIKDNRYHEQKFRLKKSGIENLIYLIEKYDDSRHVGLPQTSLYQAASNTAIQDNFFVTFTNNVTETVDYLVNMSKILIRMFKSKRLIGCSKDNLRPTDLHSDSIYLMRFKDFNEGSVKNKAKTISDLFIKMLLQIKGMSVARALAIVQNYPTPTSLMQAYEHMPDNLGENLLANIKYDNSERKIGLVLSKIVYLLFSKTQY